eukprot:6182695-Pleurochrysis_carterae.AAC.1
MAGRTRAWLRLAVGLRTFAFEGFRDFRVAVFARAGVRVRECACVCVHGANGCDREVCVRKCVRACVRQRCARLRTSVPLAHATACVHVRVVWPRAWMRARIRAFVLALLRKRAMRVRACACRARVHLRSCMRASNARKTCHARALRRTR